MDFETRLKGSFQRTAVHCHTAIRAALKISAIAAACSFQPITKERKVLITILLLGPEPQKFTGIFLPEPFTARFEGSASVCLAHVRSSGLQNAPALLNLVQTHSEVRAPMQSGLAALPGECWHRVDR